MDKLGALGLVAVAAAVVTPAARADARVSVEVVVPDPGDLEDIAFWVARGAGFFEAEGVELKLTSPEVPAGAVALWQSRGIPAAIFGPPQLVELAKSTASAVLVAEILDHGDLHALVFDRAYTDKHPEVALGMTRAVYRAQKLVHVDALAATTALLMAFPSMDRRHVEESLRTLGPRVPADPRVSSEDLRALGGNTAGGLVAASFADEAVGSRNVRPKRAEPPPSASGAKLAARALALAGFVCVVLAWIIVTARRRLAKGR